MAFNIVLVNPQIPPNTGNISRLCAATKSILHIVKPIGFSLDDRYMKRAGLDYWEFLKMCIYENIEEFVEKNDNSKFIFLSSKVDKVYWDYEFKDGDFLIFGSETKGLPEYIMEKFKEQMYTIPQYNDHVRCLNLSNSVSIVLYEAIRQTKSL
ncbi:MAG: tRNA (uridine(34)/cytosine(34)/5-carboxymethylaminomethyluridine(34)-2'-O)-methyltransferase TrmL [Candidatus Sericytochromatia bacterium]